MVTPTEIPFQNLIDALLDTETPFNPKFLYRLSDINDTDLARLQQVWSSVPDWRRQALLEDVEDLGENDLLLSFEGLCQLALKDNNPQVRLPAARTLWDYDHPYLAPVFLKLLRNDPDPEVRAVAAGALGRFVYAGELDQIAANTLHEIEEILLKVYHSDDPLPIRLRALESLGYSSREEVPELIETAFTSGNNQWVASALFAMGRSVDERWSPQVLQSLTSRNPILRSEAARAAGELEISAAVPVLIEMLEDGDDNTRLASIWSLSQIGGEGVRKRLERLHKRATDEEELEFLEFALDNLAFTDGMQLLPIFDLDSDDENDNEVDFIEEDDDEILDEEEEDVDEDDGDGDGDEEDYLDYYEADDEDELI